MTIIFLEGICEPVHLGGHIGWGVYVEQGGVLVRSSSGYVPADPRNSVNLAYYLGLESVLEWLQQDAAINGMSGEEFVVQTSSELVVRQMESIWSIRKGLYRRVALRCLQQVGEIAKKGLKLKFRWVTGKNLEAVRLALGELHKHGLYKNGAKTERYNHREELGH